jgi:polyisoprenoid-binding protein YceI
MTWTIDTAHTEINFSVRHMMISNVRGQFQKFGGTVEFDETNPGLTKVDGQIEVASLNTRDEKRDAHLKSADFFDAEKYPLITFHSTRVDVKDQTHVVLYGDLSIRDIQHEVALDVEFNGLAKSPWGTINAGFNATSVVERKDWGLNWNMVLETGGFLVGDEINITIELEIIKQADSAPVAAAHA